LDHLAEDINDSLQSAGQITIAEISKSYDIPGEFIVPVRLWCAHNINRGLALKVVGYRSAVKWYFYSARCNGAIAVL